MGHFGEAVFLLESGRDESSSEVGNVVVIFHVEKETLGVELRWSRARTPELRVQLLLRALVSNLCVVWQPQVFLARFFRVLHKPCLEY